MSAVELRPLGVRCNIGCQYCYQNVHREAGNVGPARYDMDAMKNAILEVGGPFHLFGGEPLMVKDDDLEELFRWGFEKFGENQIQTNGVLLNDRHLEMFCKYNVKVGVSLDGPGELNDARWAGTPDRTRGATEKSICAIDRLCKVGIVPAVLTQLTTCNASQARLPKMLDWMRELDSLGIRAVRLHILEIESATVREELSLSIDENFNALSAFTDLERELSNVRFDISTDLRNLLLGRDLEAACVWRACDPYTTESVHGVGGDGSRHNCGLTDKEGINFQKPDETGFERYIALYHTPHKYGGCKGCRFFLACKGQCPGTALDKDWRNRTEYCGVWKRLFTRVEEELLAKGEVPISQHPRREEWEAQMLELWADGHNPVMQMDFPTATNGAS